MSWKDWEVGGGQGNAWNAWRVQACWRRRRWCSWTTRRRGRCTWIVKRRSQDVFTNSNILWRRCSKQEKFDPPVPGDFGNWSPFDLVRCYKCTPGAKETRKGRLERQWYNGKDSLIWIHKQVDSTADAWERSNLYGWAFCGHQFSKVLHLLQLLKALGPRLFRFESGRRSLYRLPHLSRDRFCLCRECGTLFAGREFLLGENLCGKTGDGGTTAGRSNEREPLCRPLTSNASYFLPHLPFSSSSFSLCFASSCIHSPFPFGEVQPP